MEIAPASATNQTVLALTYAYNGNYEKCLARIRKAMRLSPYSPAWFLSPLAGGYMGTGQFEKALEVCQHIAARTPQSMLAQARLSIVHGFLGNNEQANRAAENVLAIDPGFPTSRFLGLTPYRDTSRGDRYAELLRQAGLPE